MKNTERLKALYLIEELLECFETDDDLIERNAVNAYRMVSEMITECLEIQKQVLEGN